MPQPENTPIAASGHELRFRIKWWRALNYFVWLPGLITACQLGGFWPLGVGMALAYALGYTVAVV